jgi:hypothetical protein
MPTSGFEPRIPQNRATADPHLSPRSAFIRDNIPWALWLNAYLPSMGTPERSTVTSIRESEYHVPCVNVWSGIVHDIAEPPFCYVTGSGISDILFSWNLLSHGCLKLYT